MFNNPHFLIEDLPYTHKAPSLPVVLWSLLCVLFLGTLLAAFITGVWSWGLMDDHNLVMMSGSVWERVIAHFNGQLASGRFQPVYSFYAGAFYKIFGSAQLFYVFHWAIVCAALFAWGMLASFITGRKSALPLFVCVCLSFYKFYDSFFYLSAQEILGLFFAGVSGLLFYGAFSSTIAGKGRVLWGQALLGLFVLFLALGTKETFLIIGAAWGLSLLFFAKRSKKPWELWLCGSMLLFISISFAVVLKLAVSKGYSSAYSISDLGKLASNVYLWGRHDLLAHSPWIILAAALVIFKRSAWPEDRLKQWGLWLSILLYAGYILILLPWATTGHYSVPIGLLFAFGVTLFTVDGVDGLKPVLLISLASLMFLFNLFVGSHALNYASGYQRDTASLLKWLSANAQFQRELALGVEVRINAEEPGHALPHLAQLYYGKSFERFIFTPGVKDIVTAPRTLYFLYGTKWGDQDLSRLPSMWYPVFVSEHWVMFRRLM